MLPKSYVADVRVFLWFGVFCILNLGITGLRVTCGPGKHPCANNASCISRDYVCDGSYDCSDRSDEKGCEDGRECKIKACSHVCEKTLNSAKCLCLKGYNLDTDERTCIDEDECKNSTLCSHICVNTPGSYHCECRSGYVLDEEGSCLLNNSDAKPSEEKITCLVGKFACYNGASCIPESFLCDGSNDCADGSDETDCENSVLCKKKKCNQDCVLKTIGVGCVDSTTFLCNNKEKCIASHLVCNGRYDCTDQSDEINCWHGRDWKLRESGRIQKQLNITENSYFESEVKDGSGGAVTRHYKSAHCECRDGYSMDDSGNCIDINECDDEPCSQICQNIPGSYSCSCSEGYRLQLNEISCKASGNHPVLVSSTYKRTSLSILGTDRVYEFFNEPQNTIMKAFFSGFTKEIIALESFVDGGVINRMFSNGTKSTSTTLNEKFTSPEGLAIDWLNNKFYITYPGEGIISACTMDDVKCTNVFINHTSFPVAIALDVLEGTMYWSDWGLNSGIYKGAMNGQDDPEKDPFIANAGSRINDLAIHHVTRVLYWCDLDTEGISYMNLDNELHPSALTGITGIVTTLDVFEDKIYYVKKNSMEIEIFNIRTSVSEKLPEMREPVIHVSIYHAVLFPKDNNDNPCDESSCSQLCLLGQSQTHTCSCYDGFKMTSDGKTCAAAEEFDMENVKTTTAPKIDEAFSEVLEENDLLH